MKNHAVKCFTRLIYTINIILKARDAFSVRSRGVNRRQGVNRRVKYLLFDELETYIYLNSVKYRREMLSHVTGDL